MEKFQMLFPSSSSSSSAHHQYYDDHHHHNSINFLSSSSSPPSSSSMNDGPSMMMMGSSAADHDYHHQHQISTNNDDHDEEQVVTVAYQGGGGGVEGGKKKGEKKLKKPRYAFQTRSQVDILDDGYRWRKYGQKAVKNNKFPRSYYRCTYQGCNVKKQVQRLTKDEGVVVTTYEGAHTHPIERPSDNFEHILNQMQIYTPF
ncbi:unnamed protein product [Linum tenue]|uniref:WRKY domain-containing protein n=1 Tax=Linum tenue TaxID=586396 RepID=A0AAV0NGJ3_9ROSI|nr:unnamed protein product [Linum tenue]